MSWSVFIAAFGLVFVIEGIMPFLSPPQWRKWMQRFLQQNDAAIRVFGLLSMLIGLALVSIARDLY